MHMVADVAPPHSVVLVMDQAVGVIPMKMGEGLIAATPSCVAVGTLSEHDGPTRIALTDEATQTTDDELMFDGVIETPSGMLAICSVLDEVILKATVEHELTRVRIWANDRTEPSDIRILLSAPG